MITVTKELHFCAAHRLYGYEGICKNIHGHNYRVFVTIAREPVSQGTPYLDKLGMVIDFGLIKDLLQRYLNDLLDHALLVNETDDLLVNFARNSKMKLHLMDGNPTAENIACTIWRIAQDIFMDADPSQFNKDHSLVVKKVKVYETDTCSAEVTNAI